MKREAEFIRELENQAQEQRKLLSTEMLPKWARGVGEWLAVYPWRVIVPMAGVAYLLLRVILGVGVRELVLAMFGGF